MRYLNEIIFYLKSINQFVNYIEVADNSINELVYPTSLRDNKKNYENIIWVKDDNFDLLQNVFSCHMIVSQNFDLGYLSKDFKGSVIVVKNPIHAFNKMIGEFFISSEKLITNDSEKRIGVGTVIEDGVIIGTGVTMGYNNVIKTGTIIGNDVKIGSNNTIGGIGFGYQLNEEGQYEIINHIGSVKIEDLVEIGNNTCIDRAVMGFTHLKKNCKIDNLVHIAHGVVIGENSLIIANSMIAGSTVIGNNSWVAPSTSILNNLYFGSDSMSGMGSIVIKNVEDRSLVVGVPAKKIKNL